VRDAAEVARDHAKAVVQRNGNAQLILVREMLQAGQNIAVVEDIVVAERRPFGEAGRAAGVLDVDGIVKLLVLLPLTKLFVAERRTNSHHFVPVKHPGDFLHAHVDDRCQVRQLRRRELTGIAAVQFGSQCAEPGTSMLESHLSDHAQGTQRPTQSRL